MSDDIDRNDERDIYERDQEITRLRAELAAERERVEQYVDDLGDLRFEVIEMTEQRDKLREALVKSRRAMEPYNSDIYPPIQGACASADAVLSETNGGEG